MDDKGAALFYRFCAKLKTPMISLSDPTPCGGVFFVIMELQTRHASDFHAYHVGSFLLGKFWGNFGDRSGTRCGDKKAPTWKEERVGTSEI